jgi:hypothetical protein
MKAYIQLSEPAGIRAMRAATFAERIPFRYLMRIMRCEPVACPCVVRGKRTASIRVLRDSERL